MGAYYFSYPFRALGFTRTVLSEKALALAVLVLGVLLYFAVRKFLRARDREREIRNPSFAPYEYVALVVLLLLPVWIIAAAIATTGVFVPRYAISAAVAVAIILAAILHRLSRDNPIPAASALIVLLAFFTLTTAHALKHPMRTTGQILESAIALLPSDNLPILVTPPLGYLELSFYASPELRKRLIHINEPDLERRYLHTDTFALLTDAISHREPLHVVSYERFVDSGGRFFLVTDQYDWLHRKLSGQGCLLQPLRTYRSVRLFQGACPRPSAPGSE
jgi:uncharacterized membrane protein YiaA